MYPPIYLPYHTPALICAERSLIREGVPICCDPEDADYILYPVPTALTALMEYTHGKTIIGGNLDFLNPTIHRIDLLKDPYYLAATAAITAEAALGMLLSAIPDVLTDCKILILGWGRIGKCLTHQLKAMGIHPAVFARKPEDRAMLQALGYRILLPEELHTHLPDFHCIINTAPATILAEYDARLIRSGCYQLDLASTLSLPGPNVVHARGLPGKCKPEASGALIARTVMRYLQGGAV